MYIKKDKIYGNGDIESISFSIEFEKDFIEAYEKKLTDVTRDYFENKRLFDTRIEYLRYKKDVISKFEIEKMDMNPEMYPPKGLR